MRVGIVGEYVGNKGKQIATMLHCKTSKVIDLFATQLAQVSRTQPPLLATVVSAHEQLNERLRKKLITMSQSIPDVFTNLKVGSSYFNNKWLSRNDLFRSDDPDIQKLICSVEVFVNERLALTTPDRQLSISSMWCIVGQTGLTGRRHSHRGRVSGVYYVDSGSGEDPESGALQFFPNWRKAIWPTRHCWDTSIAEYWHGVPTMVPQSGLLVVFPSHLQHRVKRYTGTRERIVVSFNLE